MQVWSTAKAFILKVRPISFSSQQMYIVLMCIRVHVNRTLLRWSLLGHCWTGGPGPSMPERSGTSVPRRSVPCQKPLRFVERNLLHVPRHRLDTYTAAGLLLLLVRQPGAVFRTLSAIRTPPKLPKTFLFARH